MVLLYSQIASYVSSGMEFAWEFFKEEQSMGENKNTDSNILDINTDKKFILIPKGDKFVKYKKVEG